MTTKYLSGYYPAGYTLAARYSRLVIESGARVSGSGVAADSFATIVNLGSVYGGFEGAYLGGGGSLVNGSTKYPAASIAGYLGGVIAVGAAAVVANFGTIGVTGRYGSGVVLEAGGSLTNGSLQDPNALIYGAFAVASIGPAATVANFGGIAGVAIYNSIGVYLDGGGLLTNGSTSDTAAWIRGDTGLDAQGVAAAIVNFGTIAGSGEAGNGVDLGAGGSLSNGSNGDRTALVGGDYGVLASGGATIVNFGAIEGYGGVSVRLDGSGDNELIAEAGSTFVGSIEGGGGRLELAGLGVGTISGLGVDGTLTGAVDARFGGFGSYQIGARGTWVLAGGNTLNAGAILFDQGALVNRGALTLSGAVSIAEPAVFRLGAGDISAGPDGAGRIVDYGLLIKTAGVAEITVGAHTYDDGVVEVAAGTLDFTSRLFGTGALKIDAGATLQADASAIKSLAVNFAGAAARLAMKSVKTFAATIGGFAASDTLDLLETQATGASVNGSDQLVIVNGEATVAMLQLTGSYVGTTFDVGSDGHGGSDITIADATKAPSPQLLAMAMARMASPPGAWVAVHDPATFHRLMLARPALQLA